MKNSQTHNAVEQVLVQQCMNNLSHYTGNNTSTNTSLTQDTENALCNTYIDAEQITLNSSSSSGAGIQS